MSRIVHWISFPSKVEYPVSGMFNSLREILEAELEMGFDAGICDTGTPKGGKEFKLRRTTVETKPHTFGSEEKDVVNFFSSSSFKGFYELPNRVVILHGMPSYCTLLELYKNTDAMTTCWAMIDACDYSICWSKKEEEYWKCFTPNVEYVERGVDLEFFKPEGATFNRGDKHPQVTFLEIHRFVKMPTTFLFAIKYAQQRAGMRNLTCHLGGVVRSTSLFWKSLITSLGLDLEVGDFIIGVHVAPARYYRSSDLLVAPCEGGLMSRVAVEALACGCPVILLEGSEEKHATLKCKDTPLSMADAIETVWNRVKEDPEGVRAEARNIAEKHYDVKETVRRFMEIAEKIS